MIYKTDCTKIFIEESLGKFSTYVQSPKNFSTIVERETCFPLNSESVEVRGAQNIKIR